jgi:pimeloyl-ACP methyl ester carboxylesterase
VPYVDVRDLHLYYEEQGTDDGPVVLLMHGALGTIDDPAGGWAAIVPALKDRYRLVAVEHRGHGRTDNPAGSATFEQMTDDIAEFVRLLDLGSVHLAGISDGGVVALDCALRYASFTRSIVIIGGNYCTDALTLSMLDQFEPDALEREHPEAVAEIAARHDGGKYPGFWKDLIRQVLDNNAVNPSWTVDDLHRISCPTLLVAGELDPFANTNQMIVMKREIAGAEWLIVNHASHAVHYEHPEFVGARIRDFLDRHS